MMPAITTRRHAPGRRATTFGVAYAFFVTMLGTTPAALVDLAPEEAPGRGTLIATLVNIGGLGTGPLLAGLLAQFAPDALRLPYAVHLGLLVPAAAAVLLMPEPVDVKPGAFCG